MMVALQKVSSFHDIFIFGLEVQKQRPGIISSFSRQILYNETIRITFILCLRFSEGFCMREVFGVVSFLVSL